MFGKILSLELKEKVRHIYPIVIVVGVCVFLYIYHFGIYHYFHACEMDALTNTHGWMAVFFLAVSFLSFDCFSDLRKGGWKELLSTESRRMASVILARFILMLCVVAIFFLNILILDFALVWPISVMPSYVVQNVCAALVLGSVLFPLVGVFMGMFLGACMRRWSGYLLLAVFALLYVGVFQSFNVQLYKIYEGAINLDIVSRIFTLIQPNMKWTIDELYLIPVEPYRYFLYIGWCMVFAVLLGKIFLRKKKIRNLILGVLLFGVVICFYQVVSPGCIQNLNSNKNNMANDWNTFQNEEMGMAQTADFRVTRYDMKLSAKRQLKASVAMSVDRLKDEYCFTLYRGYRILAVKDQWGNRLDYDRDKDYVTVFTSMETSRITMEYAGYSGTFVSNSNAVVLPGFFAWYPQPGFRPVYQRESVDTYDYYGYNEDLLTFTESEYYVEFSGMVQALYSNLEGKDGIFEGRSEAVTLVGGPLTEEVQDDICIVYPQLSEVPEDYAASLKASLEEDCLYLGLNAADYTDKYRKIIMLSGLYMMVDTAGDGFVMNDHLFSYCLSDPEDTASDIIYHSIYQKGLKEILLSAVIAHMKDQDRGYNIPRESYLNWEPESEVPDWPVDNMYITLIHAFDESVVNQRIMAYLQDQDNETECIEFLKALYVELEEEQQNGNQSE